MPTSPSPFFLETEKGKLFAVSYLPNSTNQVATAPSYEGAVLFIPPFADEMNKTRQLVAQQARQLAEHNFAVLILDLYGTGDSEGELVEAELSDWRINIQAGLDWLRQQTDAPLTLWGLRSGCLLIADTLLQQPELTVASLVFWQPVLSGKPFLKQFLRLRIAATLMDDSNKETLAGLETKLAEEGSLEVAGYRLSLPLYEQLAQLSLQSLQQLASGNSYLLHWLEINPLGTELPPASQRLVNELQTQGNQVHSYCPEDAPYWSSQELVEAPNLLQLSSQCFCTTAASNRKAVHA